MEPTPTPGSKPPASPPDQPFFAHPPRLGVLLVHGIGDQKRGETLDWAGEPFYQWIKHWVEQSSGDKPSADARVYLTDTFLVRPDPQHLEAPPFARMGFATQPGQPSPEDLHWVLAESWWANDFAPPTFNDLVPWGLNYGPWMLQRILRITAERLWQEIRVDTGWLRGLQAGVLFVFGSLLFIVIGIAFHIFITLLLLLALVPQLNSLVSSIQVGLAGWLGDAYLIDTSPVRLSAMVTQIRDDITWLAQTARCTQVIVIAHSGGAPLAYDAVVDPTFKRFIEEHFTPQQPLILVTYGSALSKLGVMKWVLENKPAFFARGPWLRTAGLALVLAGLPAVVRGLHSLLTASLAGVHVSLYGAVSVISFLIGAGVLAWLANQERLLDRDVQANHPYHAREPLPAGAVWHDIYAIADPVSEGEITADAAIAAQFPAAQVAPHSWEVNNLDSIVQDHTTYWNNLEQFLPRLLAILDDDGVLNPPGILTLSPEERAVLAALHARRKGRVRAYFVAGLFSLLLVPALVLALGPMLGQVSKLVLSLPIPFIAGILDMLPVSDPVRAVLVSLALVAGTVALAQQLLLFNAWRWWSRPDTYAVFNRTRTTAVQANPAAGLRDLDQAATGFFLWWLTTPLLLFLLFLVVVPWLAQPFWPPDSPWLPVAAVTAFVFLIANTFAAISNRQAARR